MWASLLRPHSAAAFPAGYTLRPAVPPLADWALFVCDCERLLRAVCIVHAPLRLLCDGAERAVPVPVPRAWAASPRAPGGPRSVTLRWPWRASNAATRAALQANTPPKLREAALAKAGSGVAAVVVELQDSRDAVLLAHLLNTAAHALHCSRGWPPAAEVHVPELRPAPALRNAAVPAPAAPAPAPAPAAPPGGAPCTELALVPALCAPERVAHVVRVLAALQPQPLALLDAMPVSSAELLLGGGTPPAQAALMWGSAPAGNSRLTPPRNWASAALAPAASGGESPASLAPTEVSEGSAATPANPVGGRKRPRNE